MADKQNLSDNLKKLQEIAAQFDNRGEIDVEDGLKKVKEGAELIKASKQCLQEIENEFNEIQKEIGLEDENSTTGNAEDTLSPKDISF